MLMKSQTLALDILDTQTAKDALTELVNASADGATEEQTNQRREFSDKLIDLRKEYRAALLVEGEEQNRAAGMFGNGDGESAEIRQLRERVGVSDYLTRAAGGLGLDGAPAELNAAYGVPILSRAGGILVPWQALEVRAFTDTGDLSGPQMQRPILQRLFGPGIFDALGVRVDSVPAGKSEWPLITAGVAPDQKVEGAAATAAVAATFATEVLKPKRLTGQYEFTHEMAAEVPGVEMALRRDMADAVRAKMSNLILNGDESTNAFEPDGFLTTLAAPANPAAASVYGDFAGSPATAVDGVHAAAETEVSALIGVESYQFAARVYRAGAGSDESASEALKRRSAMCMASSFIPVAVSNIQNGNIFHAAGPNGGGAMRGDSVAAVWPSFEVVRDIYSQASQGIVLTWVALWDAQTAYRAAAYKRVAFRFA